MLYYLFRFLEQYNIPERMFTTSSLSYKVQGGFCFPIDVPHAAVAVFPTILELKNIEVMSIFIIAAKIYDSTIYLPN